MENAHHIPVEGSVHTHPWLTMLGWPKENLSMAYYTGNWCKMHCRHSATECLQASPEELQRFAGTLACQQTACPAEAQQANPLWRSARQGTLLMQHLCDKDNPGARWHGHPMRPQPIKNWKEGLTCAHATHTFTFLCALGVLQGRKPVLHDMVLTSLLVPCRPEVPASAASPAAVATLLS